MARILFLQDQWTEFLGIMYISAVLKQHGHSCKLLIEYNIDKVIKKLRAIQPDIVAFSVITGLHHWVLNTAKKIKEEKTNTLTILGGPHATYFPEVIEKFGIDIVCRGEGEYPLLDLANALDEKNEIRNVPNLWVKIDGKIFRNDLRPLLQDLDKLPYPDREIYFRYRIFQTNSTRIFIATRGCPYNCSYCYNQKLRELYKGKGKYLRIRSVENIINEILQVRNKYRIKTVHFMDDTFTFDREWLFEFLRVYRKKINLPFICLGTADQLSDEELVKEFKVSGCYGIYFGIESGNEKIRNEILNKRISNRQIVKAANLLKKYGLKFRTYNMAGLPDETVENFYETISLNIQIKTDFPWCSIFTPYADTALCDYAVKKNLLKGNINPDSISGTYYGYSLMKQKDIKEIVILQRFFQTTVIFPQLFSVVRRLAKLPMNIFFTLWFGIVFFYVLVRSERRSFWWTIWYGLHNISFLFEKRARKLITNHI